MSDKENSGLEILGFLVLTVVSIVLNGWVLSVLWAWFIVPVFPVETISVVQAIALVTISIFIFRSRTLNTEDDLSILSRKLIKSILLGPIMALIIGVILRLL